MRQRVIIFIGVLCTAFSPALEAKRPKPFEGEPPVYKDKSDTLGKVYRQDFSGETRSLNEWPKMTMAEHYWQMHGHAGAIPAQTIAIQCNISPNGRIQAKDCGAVEWRFYGEAEYAREAGVFDNLPAFRVSNYEGKRPYLRSYKFQLKLPQRDLPEVDLTTGPLLDKGAFSQTLNRILGRLQYPARALRHDATGVQTTECQVQIDYSLICKIIAFSPQENIKYFSQSVRSMSRNRKIEEETADGTPTRGARFQFNVRWIIPL